MRTRERQRQALNDRLQADSMAAPATSRRGRSRSTVRSWAARSDCDDATRSQHEAMTAYARNSNLSRISSASVATATHLSTEAAAARVGELQRVPLVLDTVVLPCSHSPAVTCTVSSLLVSVPACCNASTCEW